MNKVILFALNALFQVLTKEQVVEFVQHGITKVKEYAAKTETKVDDYIVDQAAAILEAALNIEGNTNVMTETSRLLKIIGPNYITEFISSGLDRLDNIFEEGSLQDDIVEAATAFVRKLVL